MDRTAESSERGKQNQHVESCLFASLSFVDDVRTQRKNSRNFIRSLWSRQF